jgi:hypothetical protein
MIALWESIDQIVCSQVNKPLAGDVSGTGSIINTVSVVASSRDDAVVLSIGDPFPFMDGTQLGSQDRLPPRRVLDPLHVGRGLNFAGHDTFTWIGKERKKLSLMEIRNPRAKTHWFLSAAGLEETRPWTAW